MRIKITDLYQDRTSFIDGNADIIDAWLTVLFPEQAADVEPEEGLETLVDHINRMVQGYDIEIEPIEGLAKSELVKFQTPPKAFPNLPGKKRLVETGRLQGSVQTRPIETRGQEVAPLTMKQAKLRRQLQLNKRRVARLAAGQKVADVGDFKTLAQMRAFVNQPYNPLHRGTFMGFAQSHTGYAVARPKTSGSMMGTMQHENLHALFNHVGIQYSDIERKNLARNILFALPEQFRDTIEEFAQTGKNNEQPEEKLARIYNYLNSKEDRDKFHEGHEHGHNTRRTMSRHMKRAARFIQAISEIVDEQWLRPDVPWARYDAWGKWIHRPKKVAKSEDLKKAPVEFNPDPSWSEGVAEEGPLDMTHISSQPVEGGLHLHHWGFNGDTPQNHYYGRYFLTDDPNMPEPEGYKPDPDADTYPVRAMVGGNVHRNGDLEITALAVHPQHAGKGYGRTLLTKLASIHPVIKTHGTVSGKATEAFRKLKRDKRFAVKLGREGTDEPHEIRLRGGPDLTIKPDQSVIKKAEARVRADLKAQQPVDKVQVLYFSKRMVKAEVNSEVVQDMLGFMPQHDRLFRAAQWLSGKKVTADAIRQALWDHDGDLEDAALSAHGLELSDTNRRALHEAADMLGHGLRKDEERALQLQPAVAVLDEGKETVDDVNHAIQEKKVKPIALTGKHSGGMLLAEGKDHTYLLKPGSGGVSPAKGVAEEIASQSRREAAFYHLAALWELEEAVPQTELITIGGREYAAIHMLPLDWKNLSKIAKKDRNRVLNALNRYREAGDLHQWAVLDFVAGNPDRHGQNEMISPKNEIKLIDHGSAFAGAHFDPPNDKKSFIPYYLRAWTEGGKFAAQGPERKLLSMPTLNHARDRELRKWVLELDVSRTREVLVRYGIDPEPTLSRLAAVKSIRGRMAEGINRFWSGVSSP